VTTEETQRLRHLQNLKDAGIPLTQTESAELKQLEQRANTGWEKNVRLLESML
jgi:hypothetical protein